LAEQHGGKAGPWLDELEEAAIQRAKSVVIEGMPLRLEHALVNAGIESLKSVFAEYRRHLGG
jgi:hypothetical protein